MSQHVTSLLLDIISLFSLLWLLLKWETYVFCVIHMESHELFVGFKHQELTLLGSFPCWGPKKISQQVTFWQNISFCGWVSYCFPKMWSLMSSTWSIKIFSVLYNRIKSLSLVPFHDGIHPPRNTPWKVADWHNIFFRKNSYCFNKIWLLMSSIWATKIFNNSNKQLSVVHFKFGSMENNSSKKCLFHIISSFPLNFLLF